jgi:phosphorylcholine metabolism protein LicD
MNDLNFFAAKAMQGYLSGDYDLSKDEIVKSSYELATLMMDQSSEYYNLNNVSQLLLQAQNAVEALDDYVALMDSIKMEREETFDVDYVRSSLAAAIANVKGN